MSQITHTDILIAFVVVVIVAAYLTLKLKGVKVGGSVILDHWGDAVGIFLILLGVLVIMVSPLYTNQAAVMQLMTTGAGLITAGFVALKLKTVPDSSSSGGTVTTDTHVTQVVPSSTVTPIATSTSTLFPSAQPAQSVTQTRK